jgi:hypothetical protein
VLSLALHPMAKTLILERMADVAKEQGIPYEPDRDDNIHRLNMGVFPVGAEIIPNPYNKIPGFTCRAGQGGGSLRSRFSCDGMADDRMGPGYPIRPFAPKVALHRKVGDHFWVHGSDAHAPDARN